MRFQLLGMWFSLEAEYINALDAFKAGELASAKAMPWSRSLEYGFREFGNDDERMRKPLLDFVPIFSEPSV